MTSGWASSLDRAVVVTSRPLVWCDIDAADALRATWPVLDDAVRFSSPRTRAGTADDLHAAAFVIARTHPLRAADFERMDRLVGVTAWGVGHNHIDLAAATAHGIPVAHNPVFSTSVAEAALTLMLALAKRLPQLSADARSRQASCGGGGEVERNTELAGKTVAIVGYGRIGRQLSDLVGAMGMHVLAVDPAVEQSSLPARVRALALQDALPRADVVVLMLPLTAQTHHLLGATEFAAMRSTAYLVNVGRGGTVDEAALLDALRRKRLAGAGVDVWEQEPPDPSNPLLAMPNVIGTAHTLARTHESLARISAATAANVQAALAGRPMTDVLNPKVETSL